MGTANIAFGYAGSGRSKDESPVMYPVESEELTTSTSSAATTATAPAPVAAYGNRDFVARVFLSEIGWVWAGQNPTANKTTTGIKVPANTEIFIGLMPGDKVAVLDDA